MTTALFTFIGIFIIISIFYSDEEEVCTEFSDYMEYVPENYYPTQSQCEELHKEKKEEVKEMFDYSGPVKGVEIRHPSYGVTECVVYVMLYEEDEINKTLTPIGLEERVFVEVEYDSDTYIENYPNYEYIFCNEKLFNSLMEGVDEFGNKITSVRKVTNRTAFFKRVSSLISAEIITYKKRLEKLKFTPHTTFFSGDKNLSWNKELLTEPEGEMKEFISGVHKRVIQNPLPILNVNNQLPPPRKEPTPELGLELGELVEPAIESEVALLQLFINRD